MKTTIGIVLFDVVEELDWAGPFEVFKMAALGQEDPTVVLISEREGPVTCAGGVRVLPDCTFDNAPDLC